MTPSRITLVHPIRDVRKGSLKSFDGRGAQDQIQRPVVVAFDAEDVDGCAATILKLGHYLGCDSYGFVGHSVLLLPRSGPDRLELVDERPGRHRAGLDLYPVAAAGHPVSFGAGLVERWGMRVHDADAIQEASDDT